MYIKGVAKKDKKTKNLVNRLEANDIAIISHKDLDEMAALSLVAKNFLCNKYWENYEWEIPK